LPDGEYAMDALMDTATDILIGTGPYKYIETTDEYTQLEYFEDWWGERPDNFCEKVTFLYYADGIAKNQALLAGDIDSIDGILPEFLEEYNSSEYFELTPIQRGTAIYYLGMNNKRFNLTMRQAISYAFDYDYVLDEIGNGMLAKMTSPIPEGIMFHDDTLDYPTMNVTRAREILASAEGPVTGANVSDDDYWIDRAVYNPIATYNYTWNLGNEFRADVGILTMNSLREIGVKVELTGLTWANYLPLLLGDFDKLELYNIGWGPDYNDPSNFINPLLSNTSASNGAQVNNATLMEQMFLGLQETDETARRAIYVGIQEYVVEELMPWILMYVRLSPGIQPIAYAGNMRNAMGSVYFASYYWTGATPEGGGGIPGYSFIGLLGAAAIALGVIYKKRK
jgi:peptide/nickel transport system substrate-binding protein